MTNLSSRIAAAGIIAAAALAVTGIVGAVTSMESTSGGEVAVVRNGGPLDDRGVRGVIPPGSGVTWTGLWSETHTYPSQQRFYTIVADSGRGERTGVDVVTVPSADGVNMGIEGTVYFTLNTAPKVLKKFDDKYGTRKYTGLDRKSRHAWDGDEGWSTFLDQIIRPVIENDIRQQIARFRCVELVSSCALVQNIGSGQKTPPATGSAGGAITKVQTDINTSLAANIRATLGGDFLTGITLNLTRVTLPEGVQKAVDQAQAAYAEVSKAQARVAQARADADANRVRQEGYNKCPVCGQIDLMKAIPPNVQTYAPGGNIAVK